MARIFWHGIIGYESDQARDDALAAFTAGAEAAAEYLTPATWEGVPDVPAGITSPVDVDGLPGFTYAYDVHNGWENTDGWAALVDSAQDTCVGGNGWQIHSLPS